MLRRPPRLVVQRATTSPDGATIWLPVRLSSPPPLAAPTTYSPFWHGDPRGPGGVGDRRRSRRRRRLASTTGYRGGKMLAACSSLRPWAGRCRPATLGNEQSPGGDLAGQTHICMPVAPITMGMSLARRTKSTWSSSTPACERFQCCVTSQGRNGRAMRAWHRAGVVVLPNPGRRRSLPAREESVDAGAGDVGGGGGAVGPLEFHRRLPDYGPTPLLSASDTAIELGLERLWIKDESSRFGLPAFKVLGASWATYRLLLERLEAEPSWSSIDELRAALAPLGPLTLCAATDGNHGRAVAWTARLLGLDARIFVPAGTAEARIDAIASEGAEVSVVEGTYDESVAESARHAADEVLVVSDTSWEGYVDVPRWVIDGYSTIFAEVEDQAPAPPDVVVVQMGVGALLAAAVRSYGGEAVVVAVEPTTAACGLRSAEAGHPVDVPGPHRSIMAGLNCGQVSPVAWPTISAGVDVFVAVEDVYAEQAMRDLAGGGVVAGETGAAGLAGLYALVEAGPGQSGIDLADRSVLVIVTEGATDPVAYRRIVGERRRQN